MYALSRIANVISLALSAEVSDFGLSWWLSGKESAYYGRRQDFNPWSGMIPHASELLWAPTPESGL